MATATIESRVFQLDDIPEINDIYKRNPLIGIPSLNNVVANSSFVRSSDDKVVAYGVVKVFAEGVLILDKDIRTREKAEVVKLSTPEMLQRARDARLEYIYVIANDPGYSAILRKKYGFLRVPGELLMAFLNKKEGR